MKTYKLMALCMASLFIGACDNSLDRNASLNVSVATNENVTFDGKIITVKKGTPVQFMFTGDPDFLTFFSGETGKKYQYRQREKIDPSQIKSTTLDFGLWFQYGSLSMIEKHVYISDNFPGLSKDNFEADSILVEKYQQEQLWKELIPADQYPTKTGGSIADGKLYSYDVTEYIGKPFTIAICYKGVSNTAAQSRINFEQMYFTNVLNNNLSVKYVAGGFGFTPLNMKYKWNLDDQKTMTDNRAYGTVTNTTSGIWNLTNVANGGFFIHSSDAGKPLKYSWLVSNQLEINSCTPDQGTQIKNISQTVNSYTYTYNQVGIYNATFLANNANMEHSSSATSNLVINVVE